MWDGGRGVDQMGVSLLVAGEGFWDSFMELKARSTMALDRKQKEDGDGILYCLDYYCLIRIIPET